MPNSTTAQRRAWIARHRALISANFDVEVFGNTTYVYLAATCAP